MPTAEMWLQLKCVALVDIEAASAVHWLQSKMCHSELESVRINDN